MTQTPTDPIRDEAVKVLAEALEPWLLHDVRCAINKVGSRCDCGLARTLSTLARRYLFGTTWDAAVAALPERDFFVLQRIWDGRWETYHMASSSQPRSSDIHPDPGLALAALAAKLGSGK